MSDATVSLMVLPTRADDPETTATFYLLGNGSWHPVPTTQLISLRTFRSAVDELLAGLMQRIANGQAPGARVALRAKSQDWWDTLVPDPIKRALQQADADAKDSGTVGRLLINALPNLEWMPWELLHDGDSYLGLKFQISRLPIVANGGGAPEQEKSVSRAVSLLGTRILAAANEPAYQSWAQTFDPFAPLGVTGQRWPPEGLDDGWPTLDDLVAQREADIIHITAHGGVDTDGRQFLLLDVEDDLTSSIDDSIARTLDFSCPGPLVFGNACGSLAAGQPANGPIVTRGLGVSFFDRGASAYIGSMAPLGTQTAITFAAAFYRQLLTEGHCVGEALRRAKLECYEDGSQDPSYLFYCLYGVPSTRYVPTNGHAPGGAAPGGAGPAGPPLGGGG
jgi:CHAT domain-containing protein